jgi:hypothetical protein
MHKDIAITNMIALVYVAFAFEKIFSKGTNFLDFFQIVFWGTGGVAYLFWRLKKFFKHFQKITVTQNSIRFKNILTNNQIELFFKELDGIKEEEIKGFFNSSEITHFIKNGWYMKEVNINSSFYKNYEEIVTSLKLKYLGRKITNWKV